MNFITILHNHYEQAIVITNQKLSKEDHLTFSLAESSQSLGINEISLLHHKH